ncbi:MAG: hypothetical protein Q9M13_07010, partial [Mariprofundales bacterium]|nr:hypothetical protein [Mariprofundales bacterium]
MFQILPRQTKQQADKFLQFGPWVHGLNISKDPSLLSKYELSECRNWWIKRGGGLELRPAISLLATAPSQITKLWHSAINDGTLFVVTDTLELHRLDAGNLVLVTSALESQTPSFLDFAGEVLLLDGGYIKIIDSAWNVRLAYDAGTGARGYMHNNLSLNANTTLSLYAGSTTRAASLMTTPSWPSAFTIPPVRVEAMLGAVGSPSGPVHARVRLVADDSI